MSAPQLSVLIRGIEAQFQDCLEVSEEKFFSKEALAKRIEAISAKIAFLNKRDLFYRVAQVISPEQISRAVFDNLNESGKTVFLAGYLGNLKKDQLIAFFQAHTKTARSKL